MTVARIKSRDPEMIVRTCIGVAVLLLGVLTGLTAALAQEMRLNPDLLDVQTGRWIKIHEQKPSDPVTFRRQKHGGSAFDNRRGRLVLFGSDTHGEDWTNSPLFFNVAAREWTRLYPNDDPTTYRVNDHGIPVAGTSGNHPWAMHTFGAVTYHPVHDELIVSSFPQHLEPGRFTDALAGMWLHIRCHPTWTLNLTTGKWTPLPGKPIHFFPYAAAFDSDREVVIGYRANGIYELAGRPGTWKKIEGKGLLGYHNNTVYDSRHRALVVFGSVEDSNDIVVYVPATGQHRKMPTPGERPPKDQHTPMAFHPGIGKTVVLVDRKREGVHPRNLSKEQAETWLYDLGNDAWTKVESATLPFGRGMNYNMEYDPGHGLVLLVANAPDAPTAVWALRL